MRSGRWFRVPWSLGRSRTVVQPLCASPRCCLVVESAWGLVAGPVADGSLDRGEDEIVRRQLRGRLRLGHGEFTAPSCPGLGAALTVPGPLGLIGAVQARAVWTDGSRCGRSPQRLGATQWRVAVAFGLLAAVASGSSCSARKIRSAVESSSPAAKRLRLA